VTAGGSIFRRALGADFDRLHPRLRERFDVSAATGAACVGTGLMHRVWRGRSFVAPFLRLGAARHILFPETGTDIPFTVENYPYLDGSGREAVTFVRTFEVAPGRRRRFDATMVWSATRGGIVDFLGTHHHLAVDLAVRVDRHGGLRLRSGEQRLAERGVRCRLPGALTGAADVHEWFDDGAGRFRIEVRVTNPRLGPVFGYSGSFTTTMVRSPMSAALLPVRENPRD
jgi:hypothetical protein